MGKVTQLVTNVVNLRSDENVLNWWTLRFVDPELETLFNAENDKGIWRKRLEMAFFTFACILGALYMLGTSWSILSGGHIAFYVILAIVGTIPSLLLAHPRWQRHYQMIFTVSMFCVGVLLIVFATNVLDAPNQNRDFQSGFAALLLFLLFSVIRVTYYLALLCGITLWFVELIVVAALFHGVFPWYKILGFTFGIASAILMGACAGYFIELKHRSVLLHKQILTEESERLQISRNRLEKLLLNIFPKKILEKLKKIQPIFTQGTKEAQMLVEDRWGRGQAVLNHHYPSVSVLLVDIVGFTPLSTSVEPRAMVSILNNIFSCFDDILDAHAMEKVRTIGDAYLCVGNMTKPLVNHQEMAVRAGWQMLQYIKTLPTISGIRINLRIGISCGPVTAGVTGTTKWNYDIFGPTYSDAMFAEGASAAGCITVTSSVYDALKSSELIIFAKVDADGGLERYRVLDLLLPAANPMPLSTSSSYDPDPPASSSLTALSAVPSTFRQSNPRLTIMIPESPHLPPPLPLPLAPHTLSLLPSEPPIPLSPDHSPTGSAPSTSYALSQLSASSHSSSSASPRAQLINSRSALIRTALMESSPVTPPITPSLFLPLSSSSSSSTISSPAPGDVPPAVPGLVSRANDFEPKELGLSPKQSRDSSLIAQLRSAKFFQDLLKHHGVSNPEAKAYTAGDRRHQLERDMLEGEEQKIRKGVWHMRFSSPELEADFWNHFNRNAQKPLSTLSFSMVGALLLWVFSDLLSSPVSPGDIDIRVWILYGISIFSSAAFGVYIKSNLYLHWTSKWVCLGMLFLIGFPISLVTYYDNTTIYHFYHMFFYLCICFLYTRFWVVYSMIPVTGMTIISVYFCFLYLPARTPAVYRRNVIASVLACFLLILFNFIAYLGLEKNLRLEYVTAKLIQNEYELLQKSNETTKMLAYNILPTEIVKRMCTGVKVSIVDQFSSATILFIGMSNLYDSSRPSSVFYLLNDIYTLFDELTLSHGLEKIKAVNSTYMVASGVPQYRSDHMLQAILLAADVFDRMSQFHSAFMENGGLGLRIGIATGDVVAAIVGKRKYTYDCWSDCVNTASRMESHGVVGQIQVTEEVYNSMKHIFQFQKRGEIYVKGKGVMTTYLLDPATIIKRKSTPKIEFKPPIASELSKSEIQIDDLPKKEKEALGAELSSIYQEEKE